MQNNKTMKGSVLVTGAGIAGMQSALDCANAGLKVYLLEEKPSIGGNMARLDKTFPTNDCAMCMISPKLVEVGRHLNIDILSYSELLGVEGEAGNFTITVKRKSRYIDEEKCNGCGECETVCPVKITDSFNGTLSERKAIYRMYPQAIPNVYTINKHELPAPCRATCPAEINVQGYVALISKGKYLESLDLIRERMPFAGICGRVCHHPCEDRCNRTESDEPVSIRNLKRFVADYEYDRIKQGLPLDRTIPEFDDTTPEHEKPQYSEPIAVIGSGPAGLVCADDLVQKGYSVTIFEAENKPGGMMQYGIPAYRLEKGYLAHEIDLIIKDRVTIQYNSKLGRDFTIEDLKKQGFQSIFLGIGAGLPKIIPLEGIDAKGVEFGIPYLKTINSGEKPTIGKNIVVIGGGNVAMDVARTAIRLCPENRVSLYCLESANEMPAHQWEIDEASEEGVIMNPGWGPLKITTENNTVSGMAFKKCLSVFDKEGRFNPSFDDSQTLNINADTVILAIGQMSETDCLSPSISVNRGRISTDPITLMTNSDGIFSGGDIVTGPASVVQAVGQGHRAAESIHRYLRKMDIVEGRTAPETDPLLAPVPTATSRSEAKRQESCFANAETRTQDFSEIELPFSEEQARQEASRCLNCGICSECMECVKTCKAGAINHDLKNQIETINVGAVIVANGYDVFDARLKSEYGYGRYKNVVTGIQFERILSASGPYEGHLLRPSDNKVPAKIAWIQCVGSRDVTVGNDYCSSVCCMYAIKQTIVAKEHESHLESTIFYIDMRAFGKGFESFYNRAKNTYGTKFVRSQISSLKDNPENDNLIVTYIDEQNQFIETEFDMIVLSVGICANPTLKKTSDILGISQNRFGFIDTKNVITQKTEKEGVFVSGAALGPIDIPETVMQSSAAAALCAELLHRVRGTEVQIKEYPEERNVENEEPRIGVFVCHCGINIASTVNVEEVADYAKNLPGVVYTEHTIYTCSQDTQKRIKDVVLEQNLNRVIVASCTPRTHEPLFQETIKEAGLNKYLFEMADIREQCSWVHQQEHDLATEKAKSLVRGSVGKSKLLESLSFKKVNVTKSALVIGGGIAGMTSSLSLAKQGYEVFLVEKEGTLGGNLANIKKSIDGYNWQEYLSQTIEEIHDNSHITVNLNSKIDEINGFVGNFKSKIMGDTIQDISHGVIIVATGAEDGYETFTDYTLDDRVITQNQVEEKLERDFSYKNVVMIQCAGSRNEDRPYCSRVCCQQAVKNAITIKENNPHTKVYVLYREIRTYGYNEIHYRKARELGVIFIHFPDDVYPKINQNSVTVFDTVIDEELTFESDLVVLSTAITPNIENNKRLSEQLKVSLNEDTFFMEAHIKLRPVDFANEGIFVCGLAHSPKNTSENITQALAAAGRAACILAKDSLEVGGAVSVVDEDKCAVCLTCVRECVYNAPFLNENGKAEIEGAKCQGCGNCAAVCPAKAIQLKTFTDTQQMALAREILNESVKDL